LPLHATSFGVAFPMKGTAVKAATLRILNELPSLVVLALVVAGVDQVEYAPLIEFAGAVASFGTWLLARRKIDGPVTAARR
jgi:hypothetical protein